MRAQDNDYRRRTREEDELHERRRHLWRRYGITLETFDRLFIEQRGLCALCEEPLYPLHEKVGTKGNNLDHCHATGKVRGILHARCNSMLGHAKDRPEVLEKAAAYLRRHASGT